MSPASQNRSVHKSPARGNARTSRRSAARLAAVQALYQMELTGFSADQVIQEFTRHRFGQDVDGQAYVEPDRQLFVELVHGASANRQELDDMIAAVLAEEWTVERLETILGAILRVGAHELSSRLDVPPRVTINEYVDVANAFFSGKETGLVNGVLDRLARALRPEELAAPARSGQE